MVLAFVFISGFAVTSSATVTELRTETVEEGCLYEADFNCDGFLSDVSCSNLQCTGTCSSYVGTSCSTTECSLPLYFVGRSSFSECGSFTSVVYSGGKLSEEQALNFNPCPYGFYKDVSILEYNCNGVEVLGYCFGSWTTTMGFNCQEVGCGLPVETSVQCSQTENEVENSVIINSGSECTTGYQKCFEENIKKCSQENIYSIVEGYCPLDTHVCCDVENKNDVSYCNDVGVTDIKALCINIEDRNTITDCTPDGSFRCNQNDVEKCVNEEWDFYESCSVACNKTATDTGYEDNFCRTINLDEGGCDAGDSMCTKVTGASKDAFLWICQNDDWVLIKECASGRCNDDELGCYEGCQLFDEYCYAENNTCYYCNEAGDWIFSSICQIEVNNVTNDCSSGLSCYEGAKRCEIDWVVKCVNSKWTRTDECSFGCDAGSCVLENADIFGPFRDFSPFLLGFLPSSMEVLLYLGFVSIVIYLIWRFGEWIKQQRANY